MGRSKLNLSLVNGLRREYRAAKLKQERFIVRRLSQKYMITPEHCWKVLRKVYWKQSTLRPQQYEFFEKYQFQESSA